VLKPGGKVALLDFRHGQQYAENLQAQGMKHMQVSGLSFDMYPPVRTVSAMKVRP